MIATFATLSAIFLWLKTHETVLLMIVTVLYGLEQWLASTEKLKANSTVQLISHFVEGLINILRIVYKISTGKAMVTVLDGTAPVVTPAQPTPPTPAEVMQKAIESPATVLEAGQAAAFQQAFEHGNTTIDNQLKQP